MYRLLTVLSLATVAVASAETKSATPIQTTTTVTVDPGTFYLGQSTTITVTATSASGATPTGLAFIFLEFNPGYYSEAQLTLNAQGVATYTTPWNAFQRPFCRGTLLRSDWCLRHQPCLYQRNSCPWT